MSPFNRMLEMTVYSRCEHMRAPKVSWFRCSVSSFFTLSVGPSVLGMFAASKCSPKEQAIEETNGGESKQRDDPSASIKKSTKENQSETATADGDDGQSGPQSTGSGIDSVSPTPRARNRRERDVTDRGEAERERTTKQSTRTETGLFIDDDVEIDLFAADCVGSAIRSLSMSPPSGATPFDGRSPFYGDSTVHSDQSTILSVDLMASPRWKSTENHPECSWGDARCAMDSDDSDLLIISPEFAEKCKTTTNGENVELQRKRMAPSFIPPQPAPPVLVPMHCAYGQPQCVPQCVPQWERPPAVPDFRRMRTADILKYQLTIREIVEFGVFQRLSASNEGSRYLQQLIHSLHPGAAAMHFLCEFLAFGAVDVVAVAESRFGSLFLQNLFAPQLSAHCEALMRRWIFPFAARLSFDPFGCRVLQHIVHSPAVDIALKIEFAHCLCAQTAGNVAHRCRLRALLLSTNGNHVVQSLITQRRVPPEALSFVKHELMRDLVFYCSDCSACRVVQAYVVRFGDLELGPLLRDGAHIALAQTAYGNHVVQCLLAVNEWYSAEPRFVKFRRRFLEDAFRRDTLWQLSRGKHGSHVLESCIRGAAPGQLESVTQRICFGAGTLLRKMVFDKFGNYVLRTLFDRCPVGLRRVIADSVQRNVMRLDSAAVVRRQSEFVRKCFWFRRKSRNRY